MTLQKYDDSLNLHAREICVDNSENLRKASQVRWHVEGRANTREASPGELKRRDRCLVTSSHFVVVIVKLLWRLATIKATRTSTARVLSRRWQTTRAVSLNVPRTINKRYYRRRAPHAATSTYTDVADF